MDFMWRTNRNLATYAMFSSCASDSICRSHWRDPSSYQMGKSFRGWLYWDSINWDTHRGSNSKECTLTGLWMFLLMYNHCKCIYVCGLLNCFTLEMLILCLLWYTDTMKLLIRLKIASSTTHRLGTIARLFFSYTKDYVTWNNKTT